MIDTLTTIASFLIALGVLVFVHELGHFMVAKWAGIRVERFSLGYPPKMIGFTRGRNRVLYLLDPLWWLRQGSWHGRCGHRGNHRRILGISL